MGISAVCQLQTWSKKRKEQKEGVYYCEVCGWCCAGRPAVLITKNDEKAHVDEVVQLSRCCQLNNLLLNFSKTKEQAVNFRMEQQRTYTALTITGTPVESQQLQIPGWTHRQKPVCTHFICNTRPHCLRQLKKVYIFSAIQKTFYIAITEGILAVNFTAWYRNCRTQSSAGGGEVFWTDHQVSTAHPAEHPHQAVQDQSSRDLQASHTTHQMTVPFLHSSWLCSGNHLTTTWLRWRGESGASSLKPS